MTQKKQELADSLTEVGLKPVKGRHKSKDFILHL